MEDDWFDGRPYRDTPVVPSILVMPGDPWPSEFYSRYPDAFRLPVRIVWREGSSVRNDGSRARLGPPPATARPGATAGGRAEELPAAEPSRAVAAPVDDDRSGQGHPVGTFLRVNGFLDRLMGRPEPVQDPNTPLPFYDDRGMPVLDPDKKQMKRPAGMDPHMFVRQVPKDKEIIANPIDSDPDLGAFFAGSYSAAELSNFLWYQR